MRHDHDRTVREARDNMAEFDRLRILERWLQNYVHPELGVPAAYWCICAKIEKRWKIEYGLLSGTDPVAWCWADPGAPAPPVLEFRKPKPEPVKPRFNFDDPVDWMPSSTPRLDSLLAEMNSKITASLFVPDEALSNTLATTATEVAEGLTLAKMRAMLDSMPPGWRYRSRGPLYEPVYVGIDYGERSSYTSALHYLSMLPPPKISDHMARVIRQAMPPDVAGPPKLPPPLPSKRNQ